MQQRINTSKVLNNSYFSGEKTKNYNLSSSSMEVDPILSDQYDFAMTEDIALLNDRKDTQEKLYEIFIKSPYAEQFKKDDQIMKIPKDSVGEIFNYMKNELAKVKTITAFETVIAINEFFDFNYDLIYKKVLTPQMKTEILEDYYNNMGMKNKIDKESSVKLF